MKNPLPTRLRAPLAAVASPVLASGVALAGLGAWTTNGNAGSPPRLAVVEGHVFLRLGATPETAAFFTITNTGGSTDRLVSVTSPRTAVRPELSRHRMSDSRAAYREPAASAAIPPGDGLTMTPHGMDVTVRPDDDWREGERIPFTLRFERADPVTVLATVVRPGENPA
ncbi:copper chaperone PCu(A)C [Streptomyces sp. NPDC047515]|uniref:copper chaperone PCu(A)C n=1 Tax=Streptomyces sp. NPDC047515 TaxID=3155380 RepID=UPI0033CC1FF8